MCTERNKHFGYVSFQIWWAFQDRKSCTPLAWLCPQSKRVINKYWNHVTLQCSAQWTVLYADHFLFAMCPPSAFFLSCWKSKLIMSIKKWGNITETILVTKMSKKWKKSENGYKQFLLCSSMYMHAFTLNHSESLEFLELSRMKVTS